MTVRVRTSSREESDGVNAAGPYVESLPSCWTIVRPLVFRGAGEENLPILEWHFTKLRFLLLRRSRSSIPIANKTFGDIKFPT